MKRIKKTLLILPILCLAICCCITGGKQDKDPGILPRSGGNNLVE